MPLPVIVLSGGGHAKVLIDALLALDREIIGYTDPDTRREAVLGVIRLGDDDVVSRYAPDEVLLVNGLGSVASPLRRQRLYEQMLQRGYTFAQVIHPAAVVGAGVERAEGIQVMAGAVVQSGTRLGVNTIVNTGAVVDHDCTLEAHVHIAPGATLSGAVYVQEGAHIGTGASIIQGVTLGAYSIVGAGAVVLGDVAAHTTVVGVPARSLRA